MFNIFQLDCTDSLCEFIHLAFSSILIISLWELLALVGAKHKISIALGAMAVDDSHLRLVGFIFMFRALRDIIVYRLKLFLKGKKIEDFEDQ